MRYFLQLTTLLVFMFLIIGCERPAVMKIKKKTFGEIEGKKVYIYTLTNSNNIEIKITNYGGIRGFDKVLRDSEP